MLVLQRVYGGYVHAAAQSQSKIYTFFQTYAHQQQLQYLVFEMLVLQRVYGGYVHAAAAKSIAWCCVHKVTGERERVPVSIVRVEALRTNHLSSTREEKYILTIF